MTDERFVSFELDADLYEALRKIAVEKDTTLEKLIQFIVRDSLFSASDDWK